MIPVMRRFHCGENWKGGTNKTNRKQKKRDKKNVIVKSERERVGFDWGLCQRLERWRHSSTIHPLQPPNPPNPNPRIYSA